MTVPPAVLLELWCGVSCLCLCVRGVRYQVLQLLFVPGINTCFRVVVPSVWLFFFLCVMYVLRW